MPDAAKIKKEIRNRVKKERDRDRDREKGGRGRDASVCVKMTAAVGRRGSGAIQRFKS